MENPLIMKKTFLFAISATLMMTTQAFAIDANLSGVGGGVNVSGLDTNHAIVDTNRIHGSVGVTDWTKFNIGKGETVTNRFNAQNQHLLFRVIGDPTKINGTWNSAGVGAATGRTTLINPAGVMVGNGAVINLNALNISTVDAVNKKAGNIRLEKGAKLDVNDLNVSGGAIYSAADLLGKSVKLSTKDGVNFEAIPGVEIGGVGKGDILVGNSTYQTKDGTLIITSGNNLKFQNATIKNANANLSAKGDIVVEAGFIDDAGKVDYSMDKRAKFDNANVKISSDNGNIYMNHIDNKNGSHLLIQSKTGSINSYNNVNSGRSTYTVDNKSGEIITQNFHNDGGVFSAKTETGRQVVTNPDNNSISLMNIISDSGDVYVEGMNNHELSKVNISTGSAKGEKAPSVNIIGSKNAKLSQIDITNKNGNVNINQIKSNGALSVEGKTYVNIKNDSVLAGDTKLKGGEINVTKSVVSNLTSLEAEKNASFTDIKGNMNINAGSILDFDSDVKVGENLIIKTEDPTSKVDIINNNGKKSVISVGKNLSIDAGHVKIKGNNINVEKNLNVNSKGLEVTDGVKVKGDTVLNGVILKK